jgi:hypothetical protein
LKRWEEELWKKSFYYLIIICLAREKTAKNRKISFVVSPCESVWNLARVMAAFVQIWKEKSKINSERKLMKKKRFNKWISSSPALATAPPIQQQQQQQQQQQHHQHLVSFKSELVARLD